MSTIIPAKDVAKEIMADMMKVASEMYPDYTEAEKEALVLKFFKAYFGGV